MSREPSRWIAQLVELGNLHEGGFPFQPNDLSLDEWRQMLFVKGRMQKLQMDNDDRLREEEAKKQKAQELAEEG